MNKISTTFKRYLAMLRIIPENPDCITAQSLLTLLQSEDFDADVRTVQRDLHRLMEIEPRLKHTTESKPIQWYLEK